MESGSRLNKYLLVRAGNKTQSVLEHTLCFIMKDLSGEWFNNWQAVSFSRRKGKHYFWNFKCKCGTEKEQRIDMVKSGKTKSCGCLFLGIGHHNKHNLTDTRFYNIWCSMKQRCYYSGSIVYSSYGGRGIAICKEWLDMRNFKKDMYKSYLKHVETHGAHQTSIDRIDVNKDYSPQNCKWSNRKEQARNKVNTVYYELNGNKKPLSEIAEEFGIKYATLYSRLKYQGMSIEAALEKPIC